MNSAIPSWRSRLRDSGIHSSKATSCCWLPTSGPWTSQAWRHSVPRMWIPRWPVVGCPAASNTSNSSARLRERPPSTRSNAASRHFSMSAQVMSSSRCRPAMLRVSRSAVRSSIQRRSSGATRWSVPRIGHERTTAPLCSAARTSASPAPGTRQPMAHSASCRFWACEAVIQRTASGTEPSPGPSSPWDASRSLPTSFRLTRCWEVPAMAPS